MTDPELFYAGEMPLNVGSWPNVDEVLYSIPLV